MNLTLVTPPAAPPVALDDLKYNLRIEDTADDVMLTTLLQAATGHLDGRYGLLQRALVTQVWDMQLARFPTTGCQLELPMPPLRSIVSMKYWDTAGLEQLMNPNDYDVGIGQYIGTVRLKNGASWPIDLQNTPWPITIRFEAGFGAPDEVPLPLRQAIILLASHWFENRLAVEACNLKQVPMAFESLISAYKVRSI